MTSNTSRIVGASMFAMGVLLLCTLPLAAQDNSLKPTVNTATASGVTPPLGELIKLPQPAQYGFHGAPPLRLIPKRNFGTSVDPVEQRGTAPVANYSVLANFLGVGVGFDGYSVPDAPPDTNMAVGQAQIVQWVNVSFTVCDKYFLTCSMPATLGNTLWMTLPTGSLCRTHNDGDILAQYDRQAGRWFMSQNVFVSPYAVCIAISDTDNALGTWHVWQFPVPGNGFPDYPKIGIWPTGGVNNGYYQAQNNFGPGGSGFRGPQVCAYDRAGLLVGAPNPTQICFQLTVSEDSLLPGDLDSPIGPPNTSAGTPQCEFYIGSLADVDNSHLSLYQFCADFVNPTNSFFLGSPNTILQTVPSYSGSCSGAFGGACVPQGSSPDKLDSLGDRLMYRFAYWNDGPTCATCAQHWYVNGDVESNSGQIGVRWYEFRAMPSIPGITTLTSTSLLTYQAGTYAGNPPDSNWRWMGSMAQDKYGDILVGYSESNPTPNSNPAIYVAGRVANPAVDPLNTLEPEVLVVQGNGSQLDTANRWGDYSAMRIDPCDDSTFWYTTEYYMSTASFNWSTRIASAKFNVTHPPTPVLVVGNDPNANRIVTYNFVTGQQVASFVPDGLSQNGRGVEVVCNTVYYTDLSGGDIHLAPYNQGNGGHDITVFPNPRPGFGIQDLDYRNGFLYALTGYFTGSPIIYKLSLIDGSVISSVAIHSHPGTQADGFTVLPNDDFLINDNDAVPTYRGYDPIFGNPVPGEVITLPVNLATGVDYNPNDNSLYFWANAAGTLELVRTNLNGTGLVTVPISSGFEDISVH